MIAALITATVSATVAIATLKNTEEGQVADRYTRAVAQLADPTLEVRLGGIYALERVAIDSPRDQPTVVEVLAAYVRDHVPAATAPQCIDPIDQHWPPRTKDTVGPSSGPIFPTRVVYLGPPPDALAALSVLARRDATADAVTANLEGTCLPYVAIAVTGPARSGPPEFDLTGAELLLASLSGHMAGTSLAEADLEGAGLGQTGADKGDSQQTALRVDLTAADLHKVDLSSGGVSSGSILSRANLTDATLSGCRLAGAQLDQAKLFGVNLTYADLSQANLVGAELDGGDLSGASVDTAIGLDRTGTLPRTFG